MGSGAHGRDAMFLRTDVSDATSVQAMATAALARFGQVDILVNNAGIFTESTDRATCRLTTGTTWSTPISAAPSSASAPSSARCSPAAMGGSSTLPRNSARLAGRLQVGHYVASKAGIIGLTKALAREVSRRGVLVNAIAPGPIQTPMLDSESEAWRSTKLAELPIGRFGTVDEVAPTAVLLASAAGSYYVGQTLGPNGGDVML